MMGEIKKFNTAKILFISLIFLIALLPFASTLIQNYVDEWRYSNAVISMLHSGDYLTPFENRYHIDLRLNKPILTYWTILASFKLFGIHVFSLRIGFLFAAALTLILTALIAHNAFKKAAVTEFSVLILITQGNFFTASMRAIPDILVTFFLTLSYYGAICLLSSPRHKRLGWWCFYMGAALAFETKGLLSLLFVLYTIIFLIVTEPQIFKNHRLTQIGAAITSLIVSLSWFIAIWILHGNTVFRIFFYDQIGVHSPNNILWPFIRIPGVIGWAIFILLPWSLFSLWGLFKERWLQSIEKPHLRIYQFILGWVLLWLVILGLGTNFSVRYPLPLMPLLAILIADSLWRLNAAKRQQFGRYLLYIVIPLLIIEGLAGFSIIGQLAGLIKGIIYLLIFVSLTIWLVFVLNQNRLDYLKVSVWSIFFGMAIVFYPLSILILPEETEQIFKRITEAFPNAKLQPNILYNYHLAANIRLLSKGLIDPLCSKEPLYFPILIDSDIMQQKHFLFTDRRKIMMGYSLQDISPMDYILGTVTWTLPEKINQHKKEYWAVE